MLDLLLTIIIMSLVCCGAHVVINDDVIGLSKIKEYLISFGYKWYYKPLFSCCRCQASLWGGSTYYLLHGLDLNIIPAIIATSFLNSVFINYYYKQA